MKSKRMFKAAICFCSALMVLSLLVAAPGGAEEKSLYHRLGGYDAVAAVVDDFLGRMINDPQLGRLFKGLADNTKMRTRQLTVDFVCHATGGPCFYAGRDMKTSHKGIGINESDWQLSIKHLNATLDKFKVPQKERGEVLAFIDSLKEGIVDK